jgi:hypothetical protein
MEDKTEVITSLIDEVKEYGKTTAELYKLKAVDKSADLLSSMIFRAVVTIILVLFFLFMSIGLAFWLGSILGETWYGFFVLGGFYGVVAIVISLIANKWVKRTIGDTIVKQILK